MDGQGHMIVDGVLADNIADITGYIDQLNEAGEGQGLASLATELRTVDDNSQRQEAYFALAEASAALLKAPLNELEAAYNLLIYVLTTAPNFGVLMPVILSSLTNGIPESNAKQLVVLGVLGNLFNVLPEQSTQRAEVFSKIIEFAVATNTIHQFVPQLPQVAQWLSEWQSSAESSAEIALRLFTALKNVAPEKSFKFLVDAARNLPTQASVATAAGENALENTFTYDFTDVLSVPSIREQKELFDALVAVSRGQQDKIPAKYASNANILAKSRLERLVALAASERVLPYGLIAESTKTPEAEVEKLLIDATKAKLVQGRMNQFTKEFTVESVSAPAEFGDEQWEEIEVRLQSWKETLTTVQDVFVRDNYVERFKNLNKLLHS